MKDNTMIILPQNDFVRFCCSFAFIIIQIKAAKLND